MNKVTLLTTTIITVLALSGCSATSENSTGSDISENTPANTSTPTPTSTIIEPNDSEAPSEDEIAYGCKFVVEYLTYDSKNESTDSRTKRLAPYLSKDTTVPTAPGPKITRPERSNLPGYYATSTAQLETASYTYDSTGQPQARCLISYSSIFGDGTGNEYSDISKNLWLATLTSDGKISSITEP